MTSRPLDTTPGSWSRYRAVLDQMDGPARFRVALELSEAVREIRLAGIRSQHPGWSRRDVVARLIAEDYGAELPGDE